MEVLYVDYLYHSERRLVERNNYKKYALYFVKPCCHTPHLFPVFRWSTPHSTCKWPPFSNTSIHTILISWKSSSPPFSDGCGIREKAAVLNVKFSSRSSISRKRLKKIYKTLTWHWTRCAGIDPLRKRHSLRYLRDQRKTCSDNLLDIVWQILSYEILQWKPSGIKCSRYFVLRVILWRSKELRCISCPYRRKV